MGPRNFDRFFMASRPAMRKGYLPFSLYISQAADIACTFHPPHPDTDVHRYLLYFANIPVASCCSYDQSMLMAMAD